MAKIQILILLMAVSSYSITALAQEGGLNNRVNLEDVDIQGEGGNRGASLQKRNRFDLDERVKVRKSFMEEVKEKIPKGMEKVPVKAL